MTRERFEEFFVGYLPMPRGHRGFLRLLVPTVLWGLCALASLIAWRMSSAGAGSWDLANIVELRGDLVASPYPGVLVEREDGAGVELVLLVEEGKQPLRSGMYGLAGQRLSVRGTILARDGMRMLEMLPADDGLRILGPTTDAPPPAQSSVNSVLMGEVVDFKCYLGAMKPGQGITHRGCAVLCVLGGIPPALVVPGTDGRDEVYLLADEHGERANTLALDFVGRQVSVRGLVYDEAGGYRVLRIAPGSLVAR